MRILERDCGPQGEVLQRTRGSKWYKKQKIMILIKMDPYSDASITYGLQMGPEIFYRNFSILVDYETIFAHSADSR